MIKRIASIIILLYFFLSCSNVENIAYMQNIKSQLKNEAEKTSHVVKIKPNDILTITVVSTEPEASRIYNLIAPQPQTDIISTTSQIYTQPALQNYLVDNEGNINFPVLGVIHVKDMTKQELESYILDKIKPAFTKELPIITIRINNFSINVLGEVNAPGKYNSIAERLTIFEGLALARDMTIYGKRENVRVLREDSDGKKTYYTLNLNDRNIINSPAYFLEQNDVVYVEPNQSKSNSSRYGSAESFRISSVSVLISLATMAVTIYSATRR